MTNALSLNTAAVLVSLTLRTWSNNKLDEKISDEVSSRYAVDNDAEAAAQSPGRVLRSWKTLLPSGKHTSIGRLMAVSRDLRKFHYDNTLPYTIHGPRLLPMANYEKYMESFRGFVRQLDQAKAEFVQDYPRLKAFAARRLGQAYREDDYPQVDVILSSFGASLKTIPVPAGDQVLKLDGLPPQTAAQLKKEVEADLQEAFTKANEAIWQRLYQATQGLVHSLGKNKHLKDASIRNMRELLDVLPRLNLARDERLDNLHKQLEVTLEGITGAELRSNDALAEQTRKGAQSVMSVMAAFMGNAPADLPVELRRAA